MADKSSQLLNKTLAGFGQKLSSWIYSTRLLSLCRCRCYKFIIKLVYISFSIFCLLFTFVIKFLSVVCVIKIKQSNWFIEQYPLTSLKKTVQLQGVYYWDIIVGWGIKQTCFHCILKNDFCFIENTKYLTVQFWDDFFFLFFSFNH